MSTAQLIIAAFVILDILIDRASEREDITPQEKADIKAKRRELLTRFDAAIDGPEM